MTITATPSEVTYLADGINTIFPFNFTVDTADDLKVYVADAAGGVSEVTNFQTSGALASAGTVIVTPAPAAGFKVTVLDDPDRSQRLDYVDNDPFPAESHEAGLDKQTRISKRLYQMIQRCIRAPDGDATQLSLLPGAAVRAGQFLRFADVSGDIEVAGTLGAGVALSRSVIGGYLYPVTPSEGLAGAAVRDLGVKPYHSLRYAVGDGITDDAQALQKGQDAAALAGVGFVLQDGSYAVDITARGGSLAQTTSWYGEHPGHVKVKRKDFTTNTAYFTMQQTNQTGLILSGIIFDGQVTTAASILPNQDLAAAGFYADTTDEHLWRKPYGVRLWNATRAIVEDCTFQNFMRAGLNIEGDGLFAAPNKISKGVKVVNCNTIRTRGGPSGDGFYLAGAADVQFVNCTAYDFQRIGFVCEIARTDGQTNCRDVCFTNCLAEFGHDVVAPESNVGFWTESGDNIQHVNCTTLNAGGGFVMNTSHNADTGTTRPWTGTLAYVNCKSLRTKTPMRIGLGGTRDAHVTVQGFFGEADQLAPAGASVAFGLRAGILIEFDSIVPAANCRIDLRDIKIHAISQSSDFVPGGGATLTNGFGCIRCYIGVATTPQQLVITLDGLQTQWSKADGTDDVTAKTDFQNTTFGYFGDVVFSGLNDTAGDKRFRGHLTMRNLQNHTFGYAMVSTEIFSAGSNVSISASRVCMRRASTANNGILTLSDCPLVDFRGDVGWTEIRGSNCVIDDADGAHKDRTSMSTGLMMWSNCTQRRRILQAMAGGDANHRKLRFKASGCDIQMPFHVEPAFTFALVDGTYAHASFGACTFRNVGGGAVAATDVMIRAATATGVLDVSGAGNTFDNAFVAGGGHVIERNSTPAYNDNPTAVAVPFLTVMGALATFDPI